MTDKTVSSAPFKFKNYIIAESKIKLEPETKAESVNISIDPSGIVFKDRKIFEITLIISLTSSDGLDVNVKMIGFFEFSDVLEEQLLNNYFFVNAPAIVFPYLRSYISALTALSGCNTIIIPPMNMTPLGQSLRERTIQK